MKTNSTPMMAPILNKCPICNNPTKREDDGIHISIICYHCNVLPTIVGFYKKKRKTDKKGKKTK